MTRDQLDYVEYLKKVADDPEVTEHIRQEALFLIETYEKELDRYAPE